MVRASCENNINTESCVHQLNLKFNVTGNIEMMKLLIENGIDIDAVNNDGQSALIRALFRGNSFLHPNKDFYERNECDFLV